MIHLCNDDHYFLEICDKLNLPKLKNILLTQDKLYQLMIAGLYNKSILTYISLDGDKLNGCLILAILNTILGEKVISLVFTWIDPHYPKLYKEFINLVEEKAKELKINKLCFQTNRKEAVINRKMGKYGFNKSFSVYEKNLKEVI